MAATNEQANLNDGTTDLDIKLGNINPIEQDYDKQLVVISVPRQTPTVNFLIDLGRLKEVITLKGFFEDDSSKSALTRKGELETLMSRSGTMTLTWGAGATLQTKIVNIIKAKISETSGEMDFGDLPTTVHKTFVVTIQFAVGTNKG